jgi:hypothetical protein
MPPLDSSYPLPAVKRMLYPDYKRATYYVPHIIRIGTSIALLNVAAHARPMLSKSSDWQDGLL